MTHAASVVVGYALTAAAVLAYAARVVRRGRSLGRSLGISGTGRNGDDAEHGREDRSGSDASRTPPGIEHGRDAASAAP